MENNDYFKTMQRQINFLTSLGGLQQLFDSLATKQYTDLESEWETKILNLNIELTALHLFMR